GHADPDRAAFRPVRAGRTRWRGGGGGWPCAAHPAGGDHDCRRRIVFRVALHGDPSCLASSLCPDSRRWITMPLRRQLAILQFEEARRVVMPFAEARGYLTDEDVFRAGS